MDKQVAFRYETGHGNMLTSVAQYWVDDDGGRSEYFKGDSGDCATRAIAIATKQDYKVVYDALYVLAKNFKGYSKVAKSIRKDPSPRDGAYREVYEMYLKSIGWEFTPLMKIGSGCTCHVRADELPNGRLILRLSKHLAAFLDGNLHDTHDSSREGTRCVYGYYTKTTDHGIQIP